MSWRRFSALAAGLSDLSRYRQALSDKKQKESEVISNPDEIAARVKQYGL